MGQSSKSHVLAADTSDIIDGVSERHRSGIDALNGAALFDLMCLPHWIKPSARIFPTKNQPSKHVLTA